MSRSIFRFFFSFPVSSRPIHTERRTKRKAAVVARSPPLSPLCDRRTDRPTDRQAEQEGRGGVCMRACELFPARSVARPPARRSFLSFQRGRGRGRQQTRSARATHARSSVDGNVELGNNAQNHENDGDRTFSRYRMSPKSGTLLRLIAPLFRPLRKLINP